MNALAWLTFIAVFIVFESSPGGAFSAQGLITHHIAKRQTAADDDAVQTALDCSIIILEYQCGPSGNAQQAINIALGCRNESYARSTANVCAMNENGEICGAASSRFLVNSTELMNAASCSGAVASGSCPSNCLSFLESASSNLGCCINTFINTTDSPDLSARYSDFFDYRLWNLCNVPLPAAGCGNTLSLDPPQNAQDCTVEELLSRLVDYYCMPSVGQPQVNAVLQDDRCNVVATLLVDICATNANGQTCVGAISLDFLSSAATDPLLTSLSTNCASPMVCSPSCGSAVTNIANAYGCCVNVYNSTESGMQLPALSYSVWNSCGVDTPGFCNSSLTTSPPVLPPTTTPAERTTTEITTTTTDPSTTNQDSSSTTPSTLELDSSTSGSRLLEPVNWIVVLAALLHLKKCF